MIMSCDQSFECFYLLSFMLFSVLPDYIEKIAKTMVIDPACEVVAKEVSRRRCIFIDDESLQDKN